MSDQKITLIECGEVLAIANVADMYTKVLSHMADGYLVQFDVSRIERIDTAAIQMIYAFSKEAAKQGHALNWQDASETFIRNVKSIGLAAKMNLAENTIDIA
jgi:ABC-type transporter Mla MlaB component